MTLVNHVYNYIIIIIIIIIIYNCMHIIKGPYSMFCDMSVSLF